MPGLIIKNFRGFSEANIPLSPGANFLVGENSTGKTSILSLIDILSGHQLYFSQQLRSDYADYTAYSDAVSAKTPRADLSIGFYNFSYSKTKRGSIDACALHFTNNSSRCDIAEVSYIANEYLVHAKFRRSVVHFNVFKIRVATGITQTPVDAAKILINKNLESIKGEEVFEGKYSHNTLPMPSPLMSALNVLYLEKIRHTEEDPRAKIISRPLRLLDSRWIAPIRAKPQAINTKSFHEYSPEGEHIPEIIREGFGKHASKQVSQKLKEITKTFGTTSHLFDQLVVKEYGESSTDPFEVQVNLSGANHRVSNVGYGVSQSLPVLIEVASSGQAESFIIQQPEVHLHPRAQAAFGDFFFEMCSKRKHQLFIETHSDFLIDRFRICLNNSKSRSKPPTQILFFSKDKKGFNTASRIQVYPDGTISPNAPPEYRDFFLREELSLLDIR